jgi:alpha-L-fucosidase
MKAQLTELLTNYGEIAGVWFDGHWDQLDNDHDKDEASKVNWHYNEIYALIHRLQPQCLIGNNHHLMPINGEDFQMFEKDLPGGNTTGFGGQSVSKLPLETCETINNSWGFNITDRNYKSPKQLIQYLVKAAGYGANFLLNIGPMPNGEIQPEFTDNLKKVGEWLKLYGETIYGAKSGFIKPQDWGAVTQKGNKMYLHLLKVKDDKFLIKIPNKVSSAKKFDDRAGIKYQQLPDKYFVFDISKFNKDEVDNVIELEIQQ